MKKARKIFAVIVLIVAILHLIVYLFGIYMCGFSRVNSRLKLTEKNYAEVEKLLEDTEYFEELPTLTGVKEIEIFRRFRGWDFTFYYEDDKSYNYIRGLSEDEFLTYIQKEGYKVYFRSKEFVDDLSDLIIPVLFLAGACLVFKQK